VIGKVNLTGVNLVLSGAYAPASSDSFIIVKNDGSDAVVGTFNGLPEGTPIRVSMAPRCVLPTRAAMATMSFWCHRRMLASLYRRQP